MAASPGTRPFASDQAQCVLEMLRGSIAAQGNDGVAPARR